VGVYGLVAAIVKLDDAGLYLNRRADAPSRALGRGLLAAAPWLMKALAVAGTAAMFLVGGGILVHGLPWLHGAAPALSGWLGPVADLAVNLLTGLIAGALCLLGVGLIRRLWPGAGKERTIEP
jgi:predicted DNA repair protein MutK